MSIKVFEKFQPNTKRGVSKNCEICKKQFGFMNKNQHQCKRCFRPICAECGKTKRQVYKIGFVKTPHRLCIVCSKQSDFIKDLIKNNSLKFGQDSLIAKKWLAKLPQQQLPQFIRASSHRQLQRFSFDIFKEMWDAYNFSLRELIGLLTFEQDQKEIFNLVKQAYQQILSRGHDQKLETLLFVITFLLCFTTPYSCARIIDYLINLKQTVKQGKMMLEAYLKSLKVQQSQVKKLNDYINYKLKFFMNGLSVNTLNVECSIHLFSRIFQKSKVQELYMLFAIIIEANIQNLLNNKDSKMECDLLIVRNCELEKIVQKYRVVSSVRTNQFLIKKKAQIQKITQQSVSPCKTMPESTEQIELSAEDQSWRKTRKQTNRMNKLESNKSLQQYRIQTVNYSKKTTNYYQQEPCHQCFKNKKKAQQIQIKLRQRDQQIQNLNFKLTFNRKSTNEYTNQRFQASNNNLLNKKEQELSKLERENLLLKQRIQQLQKNNKLLINLSSNQPTSPIKPLSRPEPEEQDKIIQILKKTLQTRNKQLQQTVKKNKLLNFQIEQMQKEYSIKKPDNKQGTRDDLLKKIQELSIKINQEQDQKIKLSTEVFQLRQSIKSLDTSTSINNIQKPRKSNGPQCQIF